MHHNKVIIMANQTYNPKSVSSILEFGMMLLDKTLREVHSEAQTLAGKGGLGMSVEKYHYGYEPNSESDPDFAEAGLELKCTPLKKLKDQSMAAKERLVLNIINYLEEANKHFESSSFYKKNKLLLLMFYLYESGVDPVDMKFKLIRKWKFSNVDRRIIEQDWNVIHSKIMNGQAHTLTEGDTFYLAACMKGSKSNAEMRKQPNSEILAQQRAYSLKTGYINKIILDSYLDHKQEHKLQISKKREDYLKRKYYSDKIVTSTRSFKSETETFEQLIERRIKPFYNKTVGQIEKKRNIPINIKAKDLSYNVCRVILGIKTRKICEFEKAGITLKSIVLESERDKIIESMSFPYIRFVEMVNQNWEESDWHEQLSSKFLFAVFRKSPDRDKKKMKLVKVFFWNMPYEDLLKAESFWEETKQKVKEGNYQGLTTNKSNKICHIRPHSTKNQRVATPQGEMIRPKSFWLNNDYILDVVMKHINDGSN